MINGHLPAPTWFDHLSSDEIDELRSRSSVMEFGQADIIFSPSEPDAVFFLEAGLIRTYRLSENGREFTFDFVRPGEVFGVLPVCNDQPRENFEVAVYPCTVLRFSKKLFCDYIHSIPTLALNVLQQVHHRLRRTQSLTEDLVFRDVQSRLARVLLQLAKDFGHHETGRVFVELRLSQTELATLIGASRPTVSLSLGHFRRDGLIEFSGGHILILELDALEVLARKQQ